MSAPSKEEIASWTADMLADASRCIDIWNRAEASGRSLRGMIRPEGAYVIASLSDENERLLTDLREEVETNVELRAKLDSVRDENERLANELKAAQLDWDRLALENERLRAERAECLALLGKVEASRVVLHSPLGSVSREDVSAMVAKLRGQS